MSEDCGRLLVMQQVTSQRFKGTPTNVSSTRVSLVQMTRVDMGRWALASQLPGLARASFRRCASTLRANPGPYWQIAHATAEPSCQRYLYDMLREKQSPCDQGAERWCLRCGGHYAGLIQHQPNIA
jgi:hypothetical protein